MHFSCTSSALVDIPSDFRYICTLVSSNSGFHCGAVDVI